MPDLDKSPDSLDSSPETSPDGRHRPPQGCVHSQSRHSSIIDSATDAIICLDGEFRIDTFNRAAEKMFGFSAEEMLGRTIDRLLPLEYRDSHRSQMQFFRRTGITRRKMGSLGLLRALRADGSEFPVEVSISVAQVSGADILTAIVRDVSERLLADEQVRTSHATLEQHVAERTAELESISQSLQRSQRELTRAESKAMLSALAASMSHELRTPISNGVLAATAMADLMRSFRASVDEGRARRSDFMTMLTDADACCTLVERNLLRADDLLTSFRQVAADQASEQRRSFDLASTVKDVINTLTPTLKRHKHYIQMRIPDGIAMDSKPGPLGQIVINLVNNAYLHAFENRSGGVLLIDAEADGDWVTLRFTDDGVGMPQEHLDQLFDAFFSTKIGKGGTGLGMAIVRDLVTEALGGEIAVQSTVGVGTRFDIRLPRRLPHA